MGGKTLKFPARQKYHAPKPEEVKIEKELPKTEDVNALLDLWKKNKEKKA
ncbi:MAG TPA: hypothetical protein VJB87_02010 [Candidatus Nanoarchaeia archaeon]|nr:hypothetical protein [Candidatus Nanoarchaeia archaeon]